VASYLGRLVLLLSTQNKNKKETGLIIFRISRMSLSLPMHGTWKVQGQGKRLQKLYESFKVQACKTQETKWVVSLRPTLILLLMFNKDLSSISFSGQEFLYAV